ncbi:hypothetical protein [Stenotrophomonas sp. PS02300]|uniref:hypothetical protein n=1 Tax=Stenotrophomonas sp. PS02300 TaxID=2991426 RepID=UPI00249B00F8|nr:hypothetical protein [Stenotrophomonas sp. PS02300]
MKIARATEALVRAFSLTLLCTLVLTMVGCSRMSESWKEEVRLSDGRLIVVKRTAKGTLTRDIAMRVTGWKPEETTLRISQLAGEANPPVWRSVLIPVVMDYDPSSLTWSVVATYVFCSTWYDMGRPISPYVQYISVGGEAWRVVPLQPGWAGRRANLLTEISPAGEPRLVREADKEMLWRREPDQFKSISTSWKTNC